MEYRNEFLDTLVGESVLVKQVTAPDADEEFASDFAENPLTASTQLLQSRTAVFVLAGYEGLGATLKFADGSPDPIFVPWSAIIELQGLDEDAGGRGG